jgi:NAD-dependent DNA ligase
MQTKSKKLDVRVGDTVFVEKGGEIIPKIAVDLSKRLKNQNKYICIRMPYGIS